MAINVVASVIRRGTLHLTGVLRVSSPSKVDPLEDDPGSVDVSSSAAAQVAPSVVSVLCALISPSVPT